MSTTETDSDRPTAKYEVHKGCGGVVRMKNMPSALEWRCDKCGQLCPVIECTTVRGLAATGVEWRAPMDWDFIARAVKTQVDAFSDGRMNDGDDVWLARETEMRTGIARTANALAIELDGTPGFDKAEFAKACGLHISDGRDTYSDCHPGELTWEEPR